MDGIQQLGLPILGIIAAAGVTFYAVSFLEIREVCLHFLPILFPHSTIIVVAEAEFYQDVFVYYIVRTFEKY